MLEGEKEIFFIIIETLLGMHLNPSKKLKFFAFMGKIFLSFYRKLGAIIPCHYLSTAKNNNYQSVCFYPTEYRKMRIKNTNEDLLAKEFFLLKLNKFP